MVLGLGLALAGGTVTVDGCGRNSSVKVSRSQLERLISAGKLSEAEGVCRKVLQDNPEDHETRGSLANILCLQGDALLAEKGFFDRPTGVKVDKEPITAPKYAAARKMFESAETEARQALRKDSNNGRIRGTLGFALHRSGRSNQAIEELRSALNELKGQPGAAEVNNTLGLVYYESGKTAEALGCYQAALALDNAMPEVYRNLAVLYDEEVRFGRPESKDAAIRYYQLYREYSKGTKDAEVEKAIKELEGRGAAKSAPTAERRP
jgi:Flp pilus assembly protein TadD